MEIEKKVDLLLAGQDIEASKPRKRLRIKHGKRGIVSVALLSVILITSTFVFANLLGFFAVFNTTPDVDNLLDLDGVPIESSVYDLNIDNAVGGNVYTEAHNLSLSANRQQAYNVSFAVVDNETSGFDIQVLYNNQEVTFLVLNPGETKLIEFKTVFDDYTPSGDYTGSITIT